MFLFTIGTPINEEYVKDSIHGRLDTLKNTGMDIIYEDFTIGDCCFIKCGLKDNLLTRLSDKRNLEDFKLQLAQIIAEQIITHYDRKIVKRIIRDNYTFLNPKEKNAILMITDRLLAEDLHQRYDSLGISGRKGRLVASIMEYLVSSDTLNMDGFVNFRLNHYMEELNIFTERAVELFIAEREYNEFIKLLRYFVDIQECKMDTVHLIQQAHDGTYVILDNRKNNINNQYYEEIKSEIGEGEINDDDLLISTLITISPREIYIHNADNFKNRELLRTIKRVFCDRIHICNSCELCGQPKENKEGSYYKQ